MENAAEEFDEVIHLYMSVAPDVNANNVDVTIR